MKRLIAAMVAMLSIFGEAHADTGVGTETGLFNMDDLEDTVTYRYDRFEDDREEISMSPITLEIALATEDGGTKRITKTYRAPRGRHFHVSRGKRGEILLVNGGDGRFQADIHHFTYNEKLDDWFLTKVMYRDRAYPLAPYELVSFSYLPGVTSIDGMTIDEADSEAEPEAERIARMQEKLSYLYDELTASYKAKRLQDGPGCPENIEEITENIPVTRENVEMYNNLGFFLPDECAGHVLNEVIRAVPDRVPAYLNFADVCYRLGFMERAGESYAKYVDLMKNNGKAKRVPQYVWQRLGTE